MIAFFDASLLIYLIEGAEPFAATVRKELAAAVKKHPDLGAALCRLSWLECRVRSMKGNDSATLAVFDALFSQSDLVTVELTRDVVQLTAAICVQTGLKTSDALQAALCLQLGGERLFLTGGRALIGGSLG